MERPKPRGKSQNAGVLLKAEAYGLLSAHLTTCLNQEELRRRAESKPLEIFEVRGESGTIYQIKIEISCDKKSHNEIRLVGSVAWGHDYETALTQLLVFIPSHPTLVHFDCDLASRQSQTTWSKSKLNAIEIPKRIAKNSG
jgi:hypothetical protein